jgi:hypothetical protein
MYKKDRFMKKILFAAMVCCVAMTSVLLNGCNGNKPEEKDLLKPLDPYLVWGADLADVQKHIEAKSWWEDGNDSLEYWEDEGWHKWYFVADSLTEQYLFETKEGKSLRAVECYCYYRNVPISAARTYLEQRGYVFLSSHYSEELEANIDFYTSSDHQTRASLIDVTEEDHCWFIYYEPMPLVN